MNRRQSTELSGPSVQNYWREWLPRGLILLSLTCQIVLAMLGNRRKYIDKIWVRSIVWLAYILADSVATMAIGVLSDDTRQIYRSGDSNSLASEYEFTAFWGPFLLLHMGGMDTITAYSLEDNELWLRHCFTIVTQSVTTVYVLFMSWSTLSRLSPLFMVVFYVGLVKYCERVWALFSASEKRFRGSIPQIQTSESKIEEEYKLKHSEGYQVTTHQVPEFEVPVFDHSNPNSEDAEILMAYRFLEMVKRLFADLILGFQDRDASRAFFQRDELNADKALKIIEIELGLIYDIMYTKATVVYSAWGIANRIIGSFLILGVLVMVSLDKALVGKNSSVIDMTLVLLVAALLLDLFAFGELFLSDQTAHWLITHNRTTALGTINRIRTMLPTNWGRTRKRWSKTVGQLSLLSFCLARKKKPLFGIRILKLLGIEEIAEFYMYKTPPAPLYMDGKIFDHIKCVWPLTEQYGPDTDLKAMYGLRGCRELRTHNRTDLEWSVKMEFELSVLVWHLATEICYRVDHRRGEQYFSDTLPNLLDRGKGISQYMLYLLVEHPNMLPIGIGQIRFRDLYSDLGDFIEKYLPTPLNDVTEESALDMLMEMVKDENMLVGEGNRSNFVIFHGCKLASQLQKEQVQEEKLLEQLLEREEETMEQEEKIQELENKVLEQQKKKWNMMFYVWIEILGHAASQCKGRHHAQQLRRGGEYITHLWLLMAHFGLTHHFQIPRSRAISEAVLR
ncbi:hypothetical protein Vadar_009900 [Vaccinium darrowii]|uniref:Uncharacterized protein n=1 Tax=Vaccinium darrowii TaxID=229202 RepID=A0ACB7Z5B2_9ERIC|nr:hypothetical protein Vadar_009900 [Vaccinium darrowii]